jgi:chromosomal replication initiation ATPase DnaA
MQGIEGAAQTADATPPYRVEMAQAVVGHIYGVEVNEMRGATRGNPRAALARQIAMYLSHIVFRMSVTQIGEAFGRNRSTACYAVHHIEDMRDDPDVDRILRQLERLLRNTAGEAA